ncbi:hypothetical protein ACHAWC_001667 [Mediolabrus comicus]
MRSSLLCSSTLFTVLLLMIVVDTSSGLQPVCDKQLMRCNSRQAAELIQNRTIDDGSLLIITCDASGRGGGSKHDGIASILRLRHGVALSSTIPTNIDPADKQHHHDEEKEDLIDSVSRRTVPSRTSSEVAAIALGVKHAIKTVPSSLRNKILILSDSEFALDFYCSEKAISSLQTRNHNNQLQLQNINKRRKNSSSSKRRGKRQAPTRSTKLREEAYWRLFATLLDETPDGVILSKVKSSSRSVGLSSSRVSSLEEEDENTSWDGKGFLDHDAADHLSSNARYVSNNNDCYTPFRAVYSLGIDDLKWLAYSEEDKDDAGIWNEIIVKGNDAREDRRKRKQLRIDRILELL